MPEPTSLTNICKITLIINGGPSVCKKAYHWSIQLINMATENCICKYHVTGTSKNFKYEAVVDYNLRGSKLVFIVHVATQM